METSSDSLLEDYLKIKMDLELIPRPHIQNFFSVVLHKLTKFYYQIVFISQVIKMCFVFQAWEFDKVMIS